MPLPFLMNEGEHIDHFGNLLWSIYVDFRAPAERYPIDGLIKGCREEYAIEISREILISKPSRFRHFGESLIRDPGEAYASHEEMTLEEVDDPNHLAEARRRDKAVNRASELVGASYTRNTTSVRSTQSNISAYTFGRNGWIFCTSMEPTTPSEWELWRETLEDEYNHVSHIDRPREFARALSGMVAEQLGPQGQRASMSHTFEGERTLRTNHGLQTIFHGPVVYVDDVYSLIRAATTKHELMLLPLFAKEKRYEAQREYRFAVWAEEEPIEDTKVLLASPAMIGAMQMEGRASISQVMPNMQSTKGEFTPDSSGSESDDDANPESDEIYGLGHRLIDSMTWESEGFRAWRERASRPSTSVRPQEIDVTDLPDDFPALTASYSAVRALQDMVAEFHRIDEESPERKVAVTAAAWYAEQDIRALCQTLGGPICRITVSDDRYIVIDVSLPDSPEIVCSVAVAPSGESVMKLEAPRGQSTSIREHRLPRNDIGQNVKDVVDEFVGDTSVP